MTDGILEFDPPDLGGTAAVVTGGGSGIGEACAEALVQCGATVFLVGRRADPLREVARRLGPEGRVFQGDVADGQAMNHLAKAIQAEGYEAVHTLVNNAAILGPRDTVENVDGVTFAEVMRINATGLWTVTHALMPLLLAARPEANIVNLSSSVGRRGRATWGPYAASKAAVESMTQTWAQEFEDVPIRVNALNPGGTRTAMRAQAMPDEDPGTLPAPEQIVPSLLFFLSPQSRAERVSGRSLDARDFM